MNARTISQSRVALTGAAFAVLLVAIPAGAQMRRIEKHFTVEDKPVVILQNPSGHIQVKAWDKHEVMIVAQFSGNKIEVDTEQVANRIEVQTQVADAATSAPEDASADLVVTVPTETELQVHTDSGNVTIDSVHGNMSFDTVAADLALQDVDGYMMIKSIGGSLVCTRCSGRLDANSISGNIQLLQPTLDNVRVQTSSGNILFDGSFLSRGVYVLKNYSGTIEVRFSKADSFDVSASSLYGHVVNQALVVPDRHNMRAPKYSMSESLFGSVNDGHAKVELSSFSGTIKILKRE
jgi:DUF4097 and DUF4098 domain-containing protein YvlB